MVRIKPECRCHGDWKGVEITLGPPAERDYGYSIQAPFEPKQIATAYHFTPYDLELVRLRDDDAKADRTMTAEFYSPSNPQPQPLPINPFADVISSVLNQYPDELVRNTALAALAVLTKEASTKS